MLAIGADPAIQFSFSFKSLGGGMSQILRGKAGSAQLLKGRGRAKEVGEGRRGLGFRKPSIIQAPNSVQTANYYGLITHRWASLGWWWPKEQIQLSWPLSARLQS